MLYENKDEIKSRMVRNAAKIWGYSEINSENEFDPLISLLLNVMSAEFERLSGEILASRSRILERMIQIMTPNLITSPLPSHAILHTASNDDEDTIGAEEQFLMRNELSSIDTHSITSRSLFFAPTATFKISKSKIAFMAVGDYIFKYGENVNKELLEMNSASSAMTPSTIWLGITEPEIPLSHIQFFFSADLLPEKHFFYGQLKNAIWQNADNIILNTHVGYGFETTNEPEIQLEEILQEQININKTVIKNINDFYRQQFVTLHNKSANNSKEKPSIPKEIEASFSSKTMELIKEKNVHWIKINFPEQVSNQLLQDINCYINCFPVMNKQLYEMTYEINDLVNIIPLSTNELFSDLGDISTQSGEQLKVRNLNEKTKELQVMLRHGGVGRFDERDAQAAIENIIQLLRDDSASFSAIGKNFVANEVKNLQQIINKLEQQIAQKKSLDASTIPHILISGTKKENNKNIFIKYWSTNGVDGNGIRLGTHVTPHKSNIVNYHETYFITTTVGGRGYLSPNDKIAAYKSALLSRNRIISAEDIKLFCRLYLGNGLKDIIIEKGIQIPNELSQGYIKTIDIKINLTKIAYLSMTENNEIEYWKEFLHQQISQRSQTFLPYRIFIESAA